MCRDTIGSPYVGLGVGTVVGTRVGVRLGAREGIHEGRLRLGDGRVYVRDCQRPFHNMHLLCMQDYMQNWVSRRPEEGACQYLEGALDGATVGFWRRCTRGQRQRGYGSRSIPLCRKTGLTLTGVGRSETAGVGACRDWVDG
jgi:hypothetical protein